MAIERISSPESAALMAATAGLKRSTWPTIRVTAGAPGGGDDVAPLLHRGCNRLFDEDMKVAADAGERDLVMQMRRRGNGHRLDAFRDQLIESCECPAIDQLGRAGTVRRQRIDDPDQFDIGQPASTRA